jgi:hypothetical protein
MATTAGLSFNKGLYWKFNNSIFLEKTSYSISVCRAWQSVLLVEETGISGENH